MENSTLPIIMFALITFVMYSTLPVNTLLLTVEAQFNSFIPLSQFPRVQDLLPVEQGFKNNLFECVHFGVSSRKGNTTGRRG